MQFPRLTSFPPVLPLLLVCFACWGGVLRAAETRIPLDHARDLVLDVPESWRMEVEESVAPAGRTLRFTPVNDANASATFLVFALPAPRPIDRDNLDRVFVAICEGFLHDTVEKKVSIRRFRLVHGQGVYSVFTDPKLVGQPPKPKDYKFMIAGFVHPLESHQVVVNLMTDDPASAEAAAMHAMVESIRPSPALKP